MYTTHDMEPSNLKIAVQPITTNMNASNANGHSANGAVGAGAGVGVGVGVALNGIGTNNGTGNGYKNGIVVSRRDSAQVLTPLLPRDNDIIVGGNLNNNEEEHATVEQISVDGNNSNNNMVVGITGETNKQMPMANTSLYDNSSSNNNEWKDSEEINNLKNELLHHVKAHQHLNHNNHNHNNQGNNNGSLMNGKNGIGIGDKYNEQDPLTGLYSSQNGRTLRTAESDESDFDCEQSENSVTGTAKSPSCGLFGCRPKWARKLASTHVFMVVFLLAYILQGMYMTYFVSVITTIEKLFQIKSKTTGFLLSASEMGQISTAMLLTYFAGRGHRPRWIACGMVVFSIAAFSCSLPHFIFGDQLIHLSMLSNSGTSLALVRGNNQLVSSTLNTNGSQNHQAFTWQQDTNLCLAGNVSINSTTGNFKLFTKYTHKLDFLRMLLST